MSDYFLVDEVVAIASIYGDDVLVYEGQEGEGAGAGDGAREGKGRSAGSGGGGGGGGGPGGDDSRTKGGDEVGNRSSSAALPSLSASASASASSSSSSPSPSSPGFSYYLLHVPQSAGVVLRLAFPATYPAGGGGDTSSASVAASFAPSSSSPLASSAAVAAADTATATNTATATATACPFVAGVVSSGENAQREGYGKQVAGMVQQILREQFVPGEPVLYDMLLALTDRLQLELELEHENENENEHENENFNKIKDESNKQGRLSLDAKSQKSQQQQQQQQQRSNQTSGHGSGSESRDNGPRENGHHSKGRQAIAAGGNDDSTDNGTDNGTDNSMIEWVSSDVVVEKKSTFVAHACSIKSAAHARRAAASLVASDRKFERATHNITAYRGLVTVESPLKGGGDLKQLAFQDCDDDGEDAAGGRLLHLLALTGAVNVLVVVSRWYGGVKLGPDRFRIINQVARQVLERGDWLSGGIAAHRKGKKNVRMDQANY